MVHVLPHMKFENPDIKEGINTSREHPLKEFSQLLVGMVLAIVVLLVLLNYTIGALVKYIPYSYEQSLVKKIAFFETIDAPEQASPEQQALQKMADEISEIMALPEGMTITVHYSDDDIVNAFATLGGHVFMYKGLIDKLPNEDALAMVMAHEIAHIKYRHPITALGKGLSIMAVFGLMTGATNANDVLIGQSINLGLMQFSRKQETESDIAAIHVLQNRYQHISGAKSLFTVFEELQQSNPLTAPQIFSSHPHSQNRWHTLRDYAQQQGWKVTGKQTLLNL